MGQSNRKLEYQRDSIIFSTQLKKHKMFMDDKEYIRYLKEKIKKLLSKE